MAKALIILAALGLGAIGASAAAAQPDDRKLIIYGNDRCPANTICVRAAESERYRIPKTIRDTEKTGDDERWGSRAASLAGAGASGQGSCSNVGAGGWTGCWSQQMRQAKAARQADKEANNDTASK